MKVTFILKDLSDIFYSGRGEDIIGLNTLTDKDKFYFLNKKAFSKELKITMKVGNSNSFRDRVELNSILKTNPTFQYKIEPRKGYKLVTFEII